MENGIGPKGVIYQILESLNMNSIAKKQKILKDLLKDLQKMKVSQTACEKAYYDYSVLHSKRNKPHIITKSGKKRYCTSEYKKKGISNAKERVTTAKKAVKVIERKWLGT